MSLTVSNHHNTTNTNLKLSASRVLGQVKEEASDREQACFSFKKQPIPSRTSCHSAISSFIEPDHLGSTAANTSHHNSTANSVNSNNTDEYQLNYDEQIRAPRMSTLSKTNSIVRILEHEPLGDCDFLHRNSNDSATNNHVGAGNDQFSNSSRNTSATSNTSMDLMALGKLDDAGAATTDNQKTYCPATYDLSQPLRRYSSPSIQQHQQPHPPSSHAKTHTIPLPMSYNDLAKKSPQTADSLRRRDPRERISVDGPIRQIDEPKTPNYIPLVLRPPNFQSSHTSDRKTSFSSVSDLQEDLSMTVSMSPRASHSSSHGNSTRFMELPRNHWVPNNERALCSLCHSKFSLINRKHHCRKCGDIFCFNCCYVRASLNFKLNFDLINGVVVKVCNGCSVEYNEYIRKNFVSTAGARADATVPEPDDKNTNELLEKERKGSTQVPVDWNWSSF